MLLFLHLLWYNFSPDIISHLIVNEPRCDLGWPIALLGIGILVFGGCTLLSVIVVIVTLKKHSKT